ncbi:MAG: rhodanese-like domain-containing protein [Candidatus Neomarinimicrobiota bacterium]
MSSSKIGQGLMILALSFTFGLGYNALRSGGIPLIAEKEMMTSENVSDIDSLLMEGTVFAAPVLIDLDLAKQLFDMGVVFIDARDEEEFREGHVRGAENLSIIQIASQFFPIDPLVTYCDGRGCDLSLELSENLMLDWEFTKVFVFEGGWPDWEAAGYPTEVGP